MIDSFRLFLIKTTRNQLFSKKRQFAFLALLSASGIQCDAGQKTTFLKL